MPRDAMNTPNVNNIFELMNRYEPYNECYNQVLPIIAYLSSDISEQEFIAISNDFLGNIFASDKIESFAAFKILKEILILLPNQNKFWMLSALELYKNHMQQLYFRLYGEDINHNELWQDLSDIAYAVGSDSFVLFLNLIDFQSNLEVLCFIIRYVQDRKKTPNIINIIFKIPEFVEIIFGFDDDTLKARLSALFSNSDELVKFDECLVDILNENPDEKVAKKLLLMIPPYASISCEISGLINKEKFCQYYPLLQDKTYEDMQAPDEWYESLIDIVSNEQSHWNAEDLREQLSNHVGDDSTFIYKDELRALLKNIYFLLTDITDKKPTNDERNFIVKTFTEDLYACTPGFFSRIETIINSRNKSSFTLDAIIADIKQSEIEKFSTIFRDEYFKEHPDDVGLDIHLHNYILYVCRRLYGTRSFKNTLDPYIVPNIATLIREKCRNALADFDIFYLMHEVLDRIMNTLKEKNEYQGINKNGYKLGQYNKFLDFLKIQIPIGEDITNYLLLDDQYNVVDINWEQIKLDLFNQLLLENNFRLTDDDTAHMMQTLIQITPDSHYETTIKPALVAVMPPLLKNYIFMFLYLMKGRSELNQLPLDIQQNIILEIMGEMDIMTRIRPETKMRCCNYFIQIMHILPSYSPIIQHLKNIFAPFYAEIMFDYENEDFFVNNDCFFVYFLKNISSINLDYMMLAIEHMEDKKYLAKKEHLLKVLMFKDDAFITAMRFGNSQVIKYIIKLMQGLSDKDKSFIFSTLSKSLVKIGILITNINILTYILALNDTVSLDLILDEILSWDSRYINHYFYDLTEPNQTARSCILNDIDYISPIKRYIQVAIDNYNPDILKTLITKLSGQITELYRDFTIIFNDIQMYEENSRFLNFLLAFMPIMHNLCGTYTNNESFIAIGEQFFRLLEIEESALYIDGASIYSADRIFHQLATCNNHPKIVTAMLDFGLKIFSSNELLKILRATFDDNLTILEKAAQNSNLNILKIMLVKFENYIPEIISFDNLLNMLKMMEPSNHANFYESFANNIYKIYSLDINVLIEHTSKPGMNKLISALWFTNDDIDERKFFTCLQQINTKGLLELTQNLDRDHIKSLCKFIKDNINFNRVEIIEKLLVTLSVIFPLNAEIQQLLSELKHANKFDPENVAVRPLLQLLKESINTDTGEPDDVEDDFDDVRIVTSNYIAPSHETKSILDEFLDNCGFNLNDSEEYLMAFSSILSHQRAAFFCFYGRIIHELRFLDLNELLIVADGHGVQDLMKILLFDKKGNIDSRFFEIFNVVREHVSQLMQALEPIDIHNICKYIKYEYTNQPTLNLDVINVYIKFLRLLTETIECDGNVNKLLQQLEHKKCDMADNPFRVQTDEDDSNLRDALVHHGTFRVAQLHHRVEIYEFDDSSEIEETKVMDNIYTPKNK